MGGEREKEKEEYSKNLDGRKKEVVKNGDEVIDEGGGKVRQEEKRWRKVWRIG